jgi:Proteasome subunit
MPAPAAALQSEARHRGDWRERLSRRGDGWQPYADNGGTVVAVAGADYVIVAADTRLSDGYSIMSRGVTRVHRIGGRRSSGGARAEGVGGGGGKGGGDGSADAQATYMATAGCWAVSVLLACA